MYSIFLVSALISLCTCAPKSPRIYNVLISTKKNLAPSQALPVYEPVLRTTSLGLAFSPIIYTPIGPVHNEHTRYVHEGPVARDITRVQNQPQPQTKEGSLQNDHGQGVPSKLEPDTSASVKNLPQNVLPIEQYVPFYSPLSYEPYYSSEDKGAPAVNLEKYYENPNTNDPKQIIANLKKNPDIPDVPPPPLPVKT